MSTDTPAASTTVPRMSPRQWLAELMAGYHLVNEDDWPGFDRTLLTEQQFMEELGKYDITTAW